MSIIDFPAGIAVRSANWRQAGGIITNQSAFTGKTRQLEIGPAARWGCELEFVATRDATRINTIRSFLAAMAQPGAGFRFVAVEAAQAVSPVPATCLVNGANQLGRTLNVDGLPNSTACLVAGQLVSIALPSGDEQLVALRANATSNGSGQIALSLATPLREAPADNAVVRLHLPVATLRIADPLRWAVTPGAVFEFEPFSAVEWF